MIKDTGRNLIVVGLARHNLYLRSYTYNILRIASILFCILMAYPAQYIPTLLNPPFSYHGIWFLRSLRAISSLVFGYIAVLYYLNSLREREHLNWLNA